MRRTTKIGLLASAVMLALTGAAPVAQAGAVRAATTDGAYFEMQGGYYPHEPFVIKLTDPAEILHARELLSGATDARPHVLGRIIKRTVAYNPNWSYHLDPGTIDFFDQMIEVCDAHPTYVEDHLDEAGGAFLPGGHWCPWASRLVKEIPAN